MPVDLCNMLRVTDAPPAVAAALRAKATFPNPEYTRRRRLGLSCWNVPPTVTLWRQEDAYLALPRGLEGDLRRLAPDATITDRRLLLPEVDFSWRGTLRPEQKTACQAAHAAGGGVVVGPCGSGKTVMGLAMVAAWRQPCLWLVHTVDLARQALDRARERFDLPADAFGMIGDGKATRMLSSQDGPLW